MAEEVAVEYERLPEHARSEYEEEMEEKVKGLQDESKREGALIVMMTATTRLLEKCVKFQLCL